MIVSLDLFLFVRVIFVFHKTGKVLLNLQFKKKNPILYPKLFAS